MEWAKIHVLSLVRHLSFVRLCLLGVASGGPESKNRERHRRGQAMAQGGPTTSQAPASPKPGITASYFVGANLHSQVIPSTNPDTN